MAASLFSSLSKPSLYHYYGAGVLLSRTFSNRWPLLVPRPSWMKSGERREHENSENNRNLAMLLLHDVYFICSKGPQIHNNHGCKTTINWFRRTCKESKTTLYYWLYTMFTIQFTDLLIVYFFSFLFLFFNAS